MRWRDRLRELWTRERKDADLDRELRSHLEAEIQEQLEAGALPEQAPYAARRALGNLVAIKERTRETWGWPSFESLVQDVGYALHQLRRAPAFTAVALTSLALGIGANTAIFSLMEAALWKPLPVHEPERLRLFAWESGKKSVMSYTSGNCYTTPSGGRSCTSFSHAVFEALRQPRGSFETVFGFKPIGRITAVIAGQAELVSGQLVSGDYYAGLGVVTSAGRPIRPADDAPGASETVAVISDGFWARRFGRDTSAIGKPIRINQALVTIVGVNPAGFSGVETGSAPDVYLPLGAQPLVMPWRYTKTGSLLDDPDYWWMLVMGRLKAGVSDARALAEQDAVLLQAVRASLPDRPDRDPIRLRLDPGARGSDNLAGEFKKPLLVLGALVAVVILIACVNVANLLLARAATRGREISLRLALGAGRGRIARQLLTEGLTLGLGGGVLGVLLGYWARNAIPSLLLPSWSPSALQASFGTRVLLLSAGVTVATSVLFSLAPVWQSWSVSIGGALKDGGRAALGVANPLRARALIVVQVGLSVVLLVAMGLFARTLSNLRAVDLGFRPERLLLFNVDPPRARYAGPARKALFAQLEERLGELPGVVSASLSEEALLSGGSSQTRVGPDGRTPGPRDLAWVNDVGKHFLSTMGIPVLLGRDFDRHDGPDSPLVTVVSQRFVSEFFPDVNPVGRTFRNGDRVFEIVGVSGDTRYDRARRPMPPTFYRLYTQAKDVGAMTFEVRTAAEPALIVKSVRDAVAAIDKELPVFDVRTQTEQIDATHGRERLFVALTSAFALMALGLACVGIYGVMAQSVARRTGEIGIRMALGAERRAVLRMVLGEAGLLVALGVLAGTVAATNLSHTLESLLFEVQPVDPLTCFGAAVVMMLVALAAGWLPARRASRLDPIAALRHE